MDCSPPGSSIHEILQARILEWVAVPFSKGSSQPRDWTQVSHIAGRFFTSWARREAWATMEPQTIYFTQCLFISSWHFPAIINLFIIPIGLLYPDCHIVEIVQHVAFSNWLLSLSNTHLRFFHVFSFLGIIFILVQNNISLSASTKIYLCIHLFKDIMFASKFWKLWVKLL